MPRAATASASVDEPPLVIEPLDTHHDRAAFSCGEPALDDYLLRQASQDIRRRVAQVFVALGAAPGQIAGYYSLSAASFQKDRLPVALAKRLPHYPVPAALLGRLAVDRSQQGRGFGEILLLDAMRRVLKASRTIAIFALIVDAKDEKAQRFYERYGFQAFASEPRRLFLPLESLAKLGL
jgi:ribosomal protein S18 acetylase RimI-like enzyme